MDQDTRCPVVYGPPGSPAQCEYSVGHFGKHYSHPEIEWDTTPTDWIKQILKDHLTIQVMHASNDPEDDTRCVRIFFGDEEIASADL